MNAGLLYPTTRLTINTNKYEIIEDYCADNTNWYSKGNAFTYNKYDNAATVLDDIYAEDERKTILCFVWNKPGYMRVKKAIHGAGYYEETNKVTRYDMYHAELCDIKTEIDELCNMVNELETLLDDGLDELTRGELINNELDELAVGELDELATGELDELANSIFEELSESPPSSLTNSVIIDSGTPSVYLSDASDEILDDEDLEITALADAFDEIAASEIVNEEDEVSNEMIDTLVVV